jgi:hypothetical protein
VAVKFLMEKGINDVLKRYGKNIALQGELIGPGIQMNIYGLNEYQWRISSYSRSKKRNYLHFLDLSGDI